MRIRSGVLGFLATAALLAGCLDDGTGGGPTIQADRTADLTQPAERIPGARAVVTSIQMHEEVDRAAVDLPFADGDDAWEPRDVKLTYHGIQETYDEFGRLVKAFVFRYPQMVFVHDSITFGSEGPDIDGHYEAHDLEFAFDLADGRLMGLIDVTDGFRFFMPPDIRHPFGGHAVAAMAFKAFEAGGRQPIFIFEHDGHSYFLDYQPYQGAPPLPGDCVAWELVGTWEPPFDDPTELLPEEADEEHRTIVCMEEGHEVPLWVWSGTSKGSYRLARTGGELATPPYEGEALAPVEYARQPWQEVKGPIPVPGPLLAPPGADGGRWAQEVAERAAALYFSPGYLKYRMASETPYVRLAFLDIELTTLLGLPVPLPSLPLLGDRRSSLSLYQLTDATTAHLHIVTTHKGEPEGPDLHVADPQGYDSAETFGSPLTADQLPDLVPDGLLQGQLAPLLPEGLDLLVFVFFSYESDGRMQWIANWSVVQDCTATEDGWGASVDGEVGAIQALSRLPRGEPECGQSTLAAHALPSDPLGFALRQRSLQVLPGLLPMPGLADVPR